MTYCHVFAILLHTLTPQSIAVMCTAMVTGNRVSDLPPEISGERAGSHSAVSMNPLQQWKQRLSSTSSEGHDNSMFVCTYTR